MTRSDIKKTLDYAGRNGLAATIAAARERLADERVPYRYDLPAAAELERQRRESGEWMKAGTAPLVSVVVPAWKPVREHFEAMRASVESQSYGNFELIISEEPGGISANTNAGIARASGAYIALLDHDDLLAPDALYHLVKAVKAAEARGVRPLMVYSDEDKIRTESEPLFFAPNRKPDFNYDYLLSNNYICHLSMIDAAVLKQLKMNGEYDGSQDHELFLRLFAQAEPAGGPACADARFLHVPRVLYHWRSHKDSTAESGAHKSYAHEAGRRAVSSHLRSRGVNCAVQETAHRGFFRVQYFDDIFVSRPDIGAVGGKLTDRRGRMRGGLYTGKGEILFDGQPRGASGGFTHRAACQQDAEAVDCGNIIIRPKLLHSLSGEIRELLSEGCVNGMNREERIRASINLCEKIRERGYRILWDPLMEKRI
ncbi:MAG: glycosyltransferase [Lachnospiraceae bacterium]|nr:glycosyltransferase [Lachnospiraceae bacterium]